MSKRYRDAVTGEYITKEEAMAKKNESVAETVKPKKVKVVKAKPADEKPVKPVKPKPEPTPTPQPEIPVSDLAEKAEKAKKDLEDSYKGKDMTHDKDVIYMGKLFRKGERLPAEVKDFLIKAGG